MKTHCFRLKRGQDLLLSLKEYAQEKEIKAAAVLSAVGCVSKAKVRDAGGVNIREVNEPLEIVSLMGTLSEDRTHLHISFSRENLSTLGGHLVPGCIINTTGEIILLEIDGVSFQGEFDEETGYDELVIKNI
ncbi:PPC domain-containing DNA-binding protein [Clostridium polynesiense]|uniref:PPC domain-containing DNA-binding protein n=1 Tax=Clostridium polynesiense TaxID=1325933 RepID=UPI00058FBB38|nr:PPC domain-containing DNA-binding protein [Clostridium polynesiense]